MSSKHRTRRAAWRRRRLRVRKKIFGYTERPRVSVFRSQRNIYAQIVDDELANLAPAEQPQGGRTVVASSSLKLSECEVPEELTGKCAVAYQVGRHLAEGAKAQGFSRVVFDRSGYVYHGRVAALARGLRDGGIEF